MSSRPAPSASRVAASHGWINSETLKTRLGTFAFQHGYPHGDAARQLREAMLLVRATEVFQTQMPAISMYRTWRGVCDAGPGAPNQIVIWESLMDAQTHLLTGNSETVYAMCALDLRRDGPVVIEVPARTLGGVSDILQREVIGIGPTGADRGKGGGFLLVPPDHRGELPVGRIAVRCPTYRVLLGLRGFLVDGKTENAVGLMKQIRLYPLSRAIDPPAMTFVDGSHAPIEMIASDTADCFDDLAALIEHEPADLLPSHERFQLAAIGIEKGRPFRPDAGRRRVLEEAARFASAYARVNSFASEDPARIVYPDRRWEWAFIGGSASWDAEGFVNLDRRAAFAYIAIGMSPAMVERHVGTGSQYLWTPRDARGAYLDGGKRYRLHVPPSIPVANFWSVVAYDADSRSMLRNDQPFPSVSKYTSPRSNVDGSIDVQFGPERPPGKVVNWIQTVPGKGFFVLFRFYGPLEAFFDQTWRPGDLVEETR